MKRDEVPFHLVALAVEQIREALDRRLRHFGHGAFVGPHEAMGVLEEEVREAWDATHRNEPNELVKEFVDVAVSAAFGMASLWATKRAEMPTGFAGLTIEGDSR